MCFTRILGYFAILLVKNGIHKYVCTGLIFPPVRLVPAYLKSKMKIARLGFCNGWISRTSQKSTFHLSAERREGMDMDALRKIDWYAMKCFHLLYSIILNKQPTTRTGEWDFYPRLTSTPKNYKSHNSIIVSLDLKGWLLLGFGSLMRNCSLMK